MELQGDCCCLQCNMWKVVCVTLLLSLLASSTLAQDTSRFISIDCGGEDGKDPVTGLGWKTDTDFLASAGELKAERIAFQATVDLGNAVISTLDNAHQLTTAMVFLPGRSSRSKYCYTLDVSLSNINSSNYLVRAMFPSKKLKVDGEDLNKYGTRFYYTVDSTVVATVELDKLKTQTVELVVNSLDDFVYICLVPLEDKSSMAAISSLELRPLNDTMYAKGRDGSGQSNSQDSSKMRTTYLMTVSRLNFGGDVSFPAIRFPVDKFDRLWYPAPIPDNMKSQIRLAQNQISGVFTEDNTNQPSQVLTSAWEGVDISSNLSFTFNISAALSYRPLQSFYLHMFFLDVNPSPSGDRYINTYLNTTSEFSWLLNTKVSDSYLTWNYNYKQRLSTDVATFRLQPNGSSTLPAMINTAEILGEFDAITERTENIHAATIINFSQIFANNSRVDTAGDPCLPVAWDWLVCSIETPPRITEINLTGKGIEGRVPQEFGSLDRLTVLDLSNNRFHGSLPESLKNIVTLRALNIENNSLSGILPLFEEQSLDSLETLSLSQNKLSGNLSSLIKALDNPVVSLNLSYNNLDGSIPPEIKLLENLKTVDLSHNHLSGEVPKELFELPELDTLSLDSNDLRVLPDVWSYINETSKLHTLNLNRNSIQKLDLTTWSQTVLENRSFKVTLLNNKISEVVPKLEDEINLCPSFEGRGFLLLGGNPWCDDKPNKTLVERYLCRKSEDEVFCPTSNEEGGASKRALIIGLAISGFLVLILACILAVFLGRMLKRMKDLRQIQEALAKEDVRPPFYDYEDLKAATRDFSKNNELGKGAFGAVYKAHLADNSVVAVKLLFPTAQNIADFLKETVLITGIKHRHLIQLKGCCVRDKKRMLVYEYAENGNLAEALWGTEKSFVLTWAQRLKISVGVAKGLSYLHEELQPKIIHRDIKPQNILLDKDWNPKIADFGLARLVDEESTQRATSIGGTLGYFSPEYATQGLLTEKLDVYSYGVLLLEIVSGRSCIDHSAPADEAFLKNWAFRSYKEGCVSRIAEHGMLATGVPGEEIESFVRTALVCLQDDHEKRPSMSQVVNMLTGNGTDVAVDIVSELKDLQHLYESLFDGQSVKNKHEESLEREDRALLNMTSTSNPKAFIELSVTKAR